jgi:U3 small nucleolar RNA-associated protein 25
MASFKKKSDGGNKKKKVPKGKKARAKAKLDRQWGEVAKDTPDGSTQRVGKSRLKARRLLEQKEKAQAAATTMQDVRENIMQDPSITSKQARRKKHHRQDDDDSSAASSILSDSAPNDANSDDEVEANPLNDLLTMLRKSKSKTSRKSSGTELATEDDNYHLRDSSTQQDEEENSSDDSDDGSDDDSEDDSMSDGSADESESAGEDIQDNVDPDNMAQSKLDLFRQRFERRPLKESEIIAEKSATSLTKIPIDASGSVELQVSTPYDRTDDMEEMLSMTTNKEWQQAALSTFTSANQTILQRQWKHIHKKKTTSRQDTNEFMGNVQAPLYSLLARYCDALVTTCDPSCGQGHYKRAKKEQQQMHQTYLLHILNHVLSSQSQISLNNKLLKEVAKEEETTDDAMEDSDKYRDQGFTRPTVLVLLPTRGTCHQFVKDMYRLLGTEMEQETEERFEADYGEILDPDDVGNDDGKQPNLEKEIRRKQVLKQKGKEWNDMFGESANQDDDFKIGISLSLNAKKSKKNPPGKSPISVRLYADFFKSDIIVASPLGLKMLVTPDDADDDGSDDFLTSIEICLLQHSDVMLMQNWDHVNDILGVLNQQPKNNNSTDFSRVRNYFLEDQGAHWRQLIVSTKFMDPSLISSFKRFGKSIAGSVKVRRKTQPDDASIANILLPIKQVFQKVPVGSFAQQSQARVDYFVKNMLPQIQKQKQKHTLVFVPSYFDFCSLRNAFLKREDVVFVSVTEYSRTSEIGRGRARFLQGRKPIMLYTGRAHYFHRHAIKGAKHLVFLGLPEHAEFYTDYVNLIGSVGTASKRKIEGDDADDMVDHSATSCVVLFTKYEAHALERIVGSSNCQRMLGSSKTTFMFHS